MEIPKEGSEGTTRNKRWIDRFRPRSFYSTHVDFHGIVNDARNTSAFLISEFTRILLDFAIMVDEIELNRSFDLDNRRFMIGDTSTFSIEYNSTLGIGLWNMLQKKMLALNMVDP